MVMSMVGVLKNCPTPDIEDVTNGIKVDRQKFYSSAMIEYFVFFRETCVVVPDTGQ